MGISKFKLAWKFVTGGRTGVIDYLFDTANNLVAKIADGKREEIAKWLDYAKKVLACLRKSSWLCPEKWRDAYGLTVDAFEAVVAAAEDLQLTQDELTAIVTAFQSAYAAWRAD